MEPHLLLTMLCPKCHAPWETVPGSPIPRPTCGCGYITMDASLRDWYPSESTDDDDLSTVATPEGGTE